MICPSCEGTGVEDCPHCEEGAIDCGACSATGGVDYTCSRCGGRGAYRCPHCNGDYEGTCQECNGEGVKESVMDLQEVLDQVEEIIPLENDPQWHPLRRAIARHCAELEAVQARLAGYVYMYCQAQRPDKIISKARRECGLDDESGS